MQWRQTLCGVGCALVLSLAQTAAWAGSASNQANTPPPPQPGTFEAVIANNPISAILKGPNLWTTPEEPEDWVKATRTDKEDYMPVGITPPEHPSKVKSTGELTARKSELDQATTAMQELLAHKPVLPPIGPLPAAAVLPPPPAPGAATAPAPPAKAKPKKLAKARPKPKPATPTPD